MREAARYASTVVDDLLFRATSPQDFDETYEIFRSFDHGGYDLSAARFVMGLLRPSAGPRASARGPASGAAGVPNPYTLPPESQPSPRPMSDAPLH